LLSDAVRGGVTTIVGCLGTDGVCRSLPALLAKARGLCEEGITCYAYTGSYEIPVVTITGSVRSDVMLIDRFIGAGEIALADHRSAQMPFEALVNVVAQARVGGMLSGKSGVTNIHLGEGLRGLRLLMRMAEETEIPITQVLPTHVNRTMDVLRLGFAFAQKGGYIDFTTSRSAAKPDDETRAYRALRLALDSGVDGGHITFSSDAQGSLPRFDAAGKLVGLEVGSCRSLYGEARLAVLNAGVPLEQALAVITANPAAVLGLSQKGRIAEGMDADVVLLDPKTLDIRDVIARGRPMMLDGRVLVQGTFENESGE
jgi:beta-aspartyl-dipeptidase (metallo-type)